MTVTVSLHKLSIIIPVFNEIRTLGTLLDRVNAVELPCMEREIILVDDYSSDGSREYLRNYAQTRTDTILVLHEENKGKGAAIRSGIEKATGDWTLIQDADLEYHPKDYPLLLEPVLDGVADAVLGSRFLTGRYRRAMFFWHMIANKLLTLVSNIATDLNLTDMETCYKLIRTSILRELNLRSNTFAIEPELVVKLALWEARIYEVPISYQGRSYEEGKKIGLRDAFIALWAILWYRYLERSFTRHTGYATLLAMKKARRFNKWLFSQFNDHIGQVLLEAGCGIGNLTSAMLGRSHVTCIDNEEFYCENLRERYGYLENVEVRNCDLSSAEELKTLPRAGEYDTAICVNVLEHIERDQEVLGHFFRLLKIDGKVILLVPHLPTLYCSVDRDLGHFRRYTEEELCAKLMIAGFEIVMLKKFNRLGGFGWFVNGKLARSAKVSSTQIRLFELMMPAARLLEHVPFLPHNSLIVVGKKKTG